MDKVFIGISSESLPATNQRTAYVAATRGKEQAQIFTDDKNELFKAMSRPDDPLSAANLAEGIQSIPPLKSRQARSLTTAQQLAAVARHHDAIQQSNTAPSVTDRDTSHDR
ncbi:hypothetical protein FTUN_0731 [Frigoriglobus tundricola]|uniref:Uncharacterized protein n=1 Tax=Frigoriglobus tundricola TaxID=2774151 RepID=A0A6M5YIX0_9BACT|nr:hypothetical protein FTUN_0731 [Frigoriglobus tundricola]